MPARTAADTPVQWVEPIEREKLDLMAKGFRTAILSTLSGPLIAGWLFMDAVGPVQAFLPAAGIYALHLERFSFLRRFERARLQAHFRAGDWGRGFVVRLGVMGVLIAYWVSASIATGDPGTIFFALTLMAVLSAGALTQFCIYPRTVWAFVTPMLLGAVVQLLWEGTKGTVVSAVFMAVLWATLVAASLRFSRVMHRDIELRYRNAALVEELSQKRQEAEDASAAKSRFLAAASHDLRQPVHAVALLGAALAERPVDPESRRMLARLGGSIAHFADVVDEVLDVARLDSGAVRAELQPVRIAALLQRVDATYRELADAKGLSLWLHPPLREPDAAVQADPALLWRVLSNLVGNAVRYTDAGGVLVAVRPAEGPSQGEPHRSAGSDPHAVGERGGTRPAAGPPQGGPAPSGGSDPHAVGERGGANTFWRIEVRDSGPGIAHDQRELVFEEFYQIRNAHRSRGEGLGLGLAVAQRMAGLMGTAVRLHPASRHAPGAVFSVTLPATLAAGYESTQPLLRHAGAALQGLVVLVVDDDERARDALADLLGTWGAQVHAAGDAQAAALHARQTARAGAPARVLLTDHWLPDGQFSWDVADAVRAALPPGSPLAIGVFSGDIAAATRDDIAARGWWYAPKPVRPLALRIWLEGAAADTPLRASATEASP